MNRIEGLCRVLLCVLIAVGAAAGVLADCDLAPPDLVDFEFTPTAGDTTAGSVDVTCSMTVSDLLSGVVSSECSFMSPTFIQSRSCVAESPSAGSPQNGTFECTVTIPQYADAGVWTASARLEDRVGNERSLFSFELAAAGLPTELTIASVPDLLGPTVSLVSLAPDTINVDASDQTVTCAMTLTDALSGVDLATCQVQSPDVFQVAACTASAPSSGDRNDGVFSCDITIPRYSDSGDWTAQGSAIDRAGNTSPFFQGVLTVNSTNEDIVGPTLTDFTFAPGTADTGSADAIITCTMDVTDAPAGTRFAACTFLGPGGDQEQACFAELPTLGTDQNGTYECDLTLPAYSEGGSWSAGVSLLDRTWNGTGLDAAALAGQGFPSILAVDCGAVAVPQPVLRWDSGTTLAWDAITGALRYNVYRGFLSSLPFDYGSCQNSRDTLLTDTVFLETEDPPTGLAYQYLVSVTDGSGEGGLGTASDGASRTVVIPCP